MSYNSSEDKSAKMLGTIVVLAVLFGGLGYLFYWALPMLITFTSNILFLTIGLLVIGGVLFILLHPRTRFLIGSLIKSIFRKD